MFERGACSAVIARSAATRQSRFVSATLGCFAESVIGRRFAPNPLARNDEKAYDSTDWTAFLDASVRQCRRNSGSMAARFAFDRRISTIG